MEANKVREKKLATKISLTRIKKGEAWEKADGSKEASTNVSDDFRSKLRSKHEVLKKEILSPGMTVTRKRKRESSDSRKRKIAPSDATSLESSDVQTQLASKKRRVLASSRESSGSKESGARKEKENQSCDGGQASALREKTTGADGYFFECVVCDIGGNLLCCDKCPRTYHLECLDPPLKRTPPGKWHCPACREHQTISVKVPARMPSDVRKARSTRRVEESQHGPNVQKSFLKHIKRNETNEKPTPTLQVPPKRKESTKKRDSKKEVRDVEGVREPVEVVSLDHLDGDSDQRLDVTEASPSKRCCKIGTAETSSSRAKEAEEVVNSDKRLEALEETPACLRPEDVQKNGKDQKCQKSNPILCLEVDRIFGCRSVSMKESTDSLLSLGNPKECLQVSSGLEGHGGSSAGVEPLPALQSSVMESGGDRESAQELEKVALSENKEMAEPQVCAENVVDGCEASSASCMEIICTNLVGKEDAFSVGDVVERLEGGSAVGDKTASVSVSTDKQCPQAELEYLVKWVGRSHVHDEWVTESKLRVLAKRKLDNYKFKYGVLPVVLVDDRWYQPQRIIARRKGNFDLEEVLVRWSGLSYDECTWENLDEPVIQKCPELLERFDKFEAAAMKGDSTEQSILDCKPGEIGTLFEQPPYLTGGTLFPHQMEALNWLRKCWGRKKNVILADEMGLGKTISASAFISALYQEFKVKRPCLVLVPLSTMPNWMAEFSAWTPSLNVVEYHGSAKARAIIRQFEWHAGETPQNKRTQRTFKYNVLLTTYEMVLADANQLRAVPWEVLVVDEGHRLKNSGSKLFQLLNTFSFSHRILLTGTPLQNNVGEMHNLLNFLQPDTFPSLAAFEEKFNSMSTTEQIEELKKMVAPHMLRRLKKDAMQNIPPKTERVVPVELTSVQAEYYRALLTRNYQVLRQSGKAAQHKSLVNIVVQLRKVCNHPYLISGTEPESGSAEFLHEMRIKASGKLTLLHSMLKSLRKQGHRVLIFSQMTKLLDILEDYLTVEYGHQAFERVDGSVSVAERQAAIARFNQDTSRFVFLLSTRACGLGINLATADTVIIYDSDFNPHADIQAMNRAHRIGQSKRLLVYRLVVRASVEERILQLAKKKLMLDHLFANKSGSQKEVEDILKWGTEELFQDAPTQQGEGLETLSHPDMVIDNLDEPDLKQRKKLGGLGDVYEDTCHKVGRPKLIWDEAAIARLLDRSNLVSEVTEGETESDMLGSLKAWDWNEQDNNDDQEPIESSSKRDTSSPADGNNLCLAQGNDEESSWDKILRRRWEKLQNEEEGALGRGKRMRKAVSYKDDFNAVAAEFFTESGNEDEIEAEPEYTPAGRALKTKLAKLRARQKERIASRGSKSVLEMLEAHWVDNSAAKGYGMGTENHSNLEPSSRQEPCSLISGNGVNLATSAADTNNRMLATTKSQQQKDNDTFFEAHASSATILAASTEEGKTISQMKQTDLHTNKMPTTSSTSSVPKLGLAHLMEGDVKISKSLCPPIEVQPDHSLLDPLQGGGAAKSRGGHALELGQSSCSTSGLLFLGDQPVSGNVHQGTSLNLTMSLGLGGTSLDTASAMRSLKNVLNSRPPFGPPPIFYTQVPEASGCPINMENSIGHGMNMLGKSSSNLNEDIQVRSYPLLPFFGGMAGCTPVMENPAAWTEEELDALWSGIRRHGRGNWLSMLRDPKLRFAKFRTAKDLADRWNDEQLKLFGGTFNWPDSSTSNREGTKCLMSSSFMGSSGVQAPVPPVMHRENLFGSGRHKGSIGTAGLGQLQENIPSTFSVENIAQWGLPDERTAGLPAMHQIGMDLKSRLAHVGSIAKACVAASKEEDTAMLEFGSKLNLSRPATSAFSSSSGAHKGQGESSFSNHGFIDRFGLFPQTNSQGPPLLFNRSILDPLGTNSASRGSVGDADWKFSNLQLRYGKAVAPTQMEPMELPKFHNAPEKTSLRLQDFQSFAGPLNLSSDLSVKVPETQGACFPLFKSSSAKNLLVNVASPATLDKQKVKSSQNGSLSAGEGCNKSNVSPNLPHWLREAFKPPPPVEPALPSAIAAISQVIDLVYSDCNSILPAWINPGPLPVLPHRKAKRRRKKKGSGLVRRVAADAPFVNRDHLGFTMPPNLALLEKQNQLSIPVPNLNSKLLDGSFASLESLHSSMLSSLPSCPSLQWPPAQNVERRDKSSIPMAPDFGAHIVNTGTQSLATSISSNLQGATLKASSMSPNQFPFSSLDSLLSKGMEVLKSQNTGILEQQWPLFGSGSKEGVHSWSQANTSYSGASQQVPHANKTQSGVTQEVPSEDAPSPKNNLAGSKKAETEDSSSKTHSDPGLQISDRLITNNDTSSEQTVSDNQNSKDCL